LYEANFRPMAESWTALGAGVLVQPHGHSTRLEYEWIVNRIPVVVMGAASVSFGPR
jgi:hypothetical protein